MQTSHRQIAAFAEVALHGSFSRAANSMGVTQSSVTQLVAKLEQQVGASLFARRRKGLELTPAGWELLELADRARNLDKLINEKMAEYEGTERGSISIIANTPRPALQIIANFAELYPKIHIDITMVNWSTAMENLDHRQVDVAIVVEPKLMNEMTMRELSSSSYIAYMRSEHRLASSKILNISDLAKERVILPEDGSLTHQVFDSCLKKHKLSLEKIIRTATYPMLKESVLHGAGIGIILEDSMHPTEQTVAVPIRELRAKYRTFIVAPKEKSKLRLVKRFFDVASETVC